MFKSCNMWPEFMWLSEMHLPLTAFEIYFPTLVEHSKTYDITRNSVTQVTDHATYMQDAKGVDYLIVH